MVRFTACESRLDFLRKKEIDGNHRTRRDISEHRCGLVRLAGEGLRETRRRHWCPQGPGWDPRGHSQRWMPGRHPRAATPHRECPPKYQYTHTGACEVFFTPCRPVRLFLNNVILTVVLLSTHVNLFLFLNYCGVSQDMDTS